MSFQATLGTINKFQEVKQQNYLFYTLKLLLCFNFAETTTNNVRPKYLLYKPTNIFKISFPMVFFRTSIMQVVSVYCTVIEKQVQFDSKIWFSSAIVYHETNSSSLLFPWSTPLLIKHVDQAQFFLEKQWCSSSTEFLNRSSLQLKLYWRIIM